MMRTLNNTAHKVLDVAEKLTQLNGFNAFSYSDLQKEVGVKTSSIHYYFPTKQDLALNMTERYIDSFGTILSGITDKASTGVSQLESLGQIYGDVVSQGKFCMCGMLASDMLSLPEVVNDKLCDFFQIVEDWIAGAIKLGQEQNSFKSELNPGNAASYFLAALEGGMLIARARKDPAHLEQIITEAIIQLRI